MDTVKKYSVHPSAWSRKRQFDDIEDDVNEVAVNCNTTPTLDLESPSASTGIHHDDLVVVTCSAATGSGVDGERTPGSTMVSESFGDVAQGLIDKSNEVDNEPEEPTAMPTTTLASSCNPDEGSDDTSYLLLKNLFYYPPISSPVSSSSYTALLKFWHA
ncbi:hypothetical protein PAXRUDRAFT_29021, partial [Paxillus rubicundulus Ve08.2h10]